MQKSKVKRQNHKLKVKSFNFYVLVLPFAFYLLSLIGCATVSRKEALPTYNIGGVTYVPLVSLCESKNIAWEYDTFTRTAHLSKGAHKINLMVGQSLVIVDDIPQYLKHPVDIYQGTVVLPFKFKEQVLDSLFKEPYPKRQITLPLTRIKKIVIDAGHGGKDPGTIGKLGLREKDVNLDIAKRLSKLLRADGIDVVMTRSTDSFISLERRVVIANDSRADLFISIHSNANRVRSLNGLEVYYISANVGDSKRALYCAQNAALNLDKSSFAYTPSLNLKATLWDMIHASNRADSVRLARGVCSAIDNNLNTRVLGIKGAPFYVLKGARMPAILIEAGFLSNNQEERLLKNAYYRQQIAESIEQGIHRYVRDFRLMEAAK